jgi:hypothetical protein
MQTETPTPTEIATVRPMAICWQKEKLKEMPMVKPKPKEMLMEKQMEKLMVTMTEKPTETGWHSHPSHRLQ